jgi:hypothetical protein
VRRLAIKVAAKQGVHADQTERGQEIIAKANAIAVKVFGSLDSRGCTASYILRRVYWDLLSELRTEWRRKKLAPKTQEIRPPGEADGPFEDSALEASDFEDEAPKRRGECRDPQDVVNYRIPKSVLEEVIYYETVHLARLAAVEARGTLGAEEIEICRLGEQGLSAPAIAKELGMSLYKVRRWKADIGKCLRAKAARYFVTPRDVARMLSQGGHLERPRAA